MRATNNRWMAVGSVLMGLAIVSLTVTAAEPQRKKERRKLFGRNQPAPSPVWEEAKKVFASLPEKMPGSEKDSKEKIALGEKLYNEKCISINKTQSCNSCHRVDEGRGGVDNQPTSPGAEGKLGGRNSPTTLNAGLHIAQFWDGRAPDLVAQAKGPVLNPIEMGMPDEGAVLGRLKEAGYEDEFKKVFGGDNALTYDNYAQAVAAFERTLVTRDRFDDFLAGKADALTAQEEKGLKTFMSMGCTNCHAGALLGGDRYEKMGDAKPYANTEDLGRNKVTNKDEDKFVFKVPSLRNIAITQPYFHDGKAATLEDAVKQMADLQLGHDLKPEEVADVIAFLKALTDKKRSGGH